MRNLLLALLLSMQPAMAINTATGTGMTPLIVFRNHATRTTEIDFAPAKSFTNTADDVYDFTPSPSANAADYTNTLAGYIYSPFANPTGAPSPDYAGFLNDCVTDPSAPNFSVALMYCQAIAVPTMTGPQRATLINQGKTAITNAYGATTAAAIFTQVGIYLTNRNIPTQ